MSSIWGNKLKISVFGESHGEGIGVTIDGFPSGFEVDLDFINNQMNRRRPGKNKLSTTRNEADKLNIISGIFNGKTTGAPICCIIYNEDKKSKDYEKIINCPRPGHSDYTASVKYNGFNDYRGGGHFSGRLTALLVFAGALCMSLLQKKYNIYIASHIQNIHGVEDESLKLSDMNIEYLEKLSSMDFPVLSIEQGESMKKEILGAKDRLDSVGGIIETCVINMPVGIGEPMFDSVESRLSHMIFSIPAVKGIEFGDGFELAKLYGSEANDEFYIDSNECIKTYTNNNGGILGGLTNGMPITFKTCIKPTPSIAIKQNTVNIVNKQNTEISIEGRHDPCIVQRAMPVIECATAIVLLDFLNNWKRANSMKKFGLVGERLGHTFSPIIHKKILDYIKVAGEYGVLEFPKSYIPDIVKELKNKYYTGVNVTIPYKTDIMAYLDDISIEAKKIGAINTIHFLGDKAIGYNTDYFGFGMLLDYYNIDVNNKTTLLLGTGGASRAVAQYLEDNNIKNIQFASTNVENAKSKYPNYEIFSYNNLNEFKKADIVINCTPVGMFKDKENTPINKEHLNKFDIAVDLIYNPIETTFLKQARELGLKTANGLYMLVAQAVKSQEIWNNVKINNNIIDEINSLLLKELEYE